MDMENEMDIYGWRTGWQDEPWPVDKNAWKLTAESIRASEVAWNQGDWFTSVHQHEVFNPADENLCGYAACFAGHCAIAHGFPMVVAPSYAIWMAWTGEGPTPSPETLKQRWDEAEASGDRTVSGLEHIDDVAIRLLAPGASDEVTEVLAAMFDADFARGISNLAFADLLERVAECETVGEAAELIGEHRGPGF